MSLPISIAICTRNRLKLLEKAVRSVLEQADDEVELLIVDNDSSDDTSKFAVKLSENDARIKYIAEPTPGISAARNAALRRAKNEWVIFLDDDAQAGPDWIVNYRQFFSNPPESNIAVVGGAVIPEFEIAPPFWMNGHQKLDYGEKPFRLALDENPWECNCAWRRIAALQVGAFDPQFGPRGGVMGYREGADLNLRLQKAGYQIWWLPGASIRHLIRAEKLHWRECLRLSYCEGRSIALLRRKSRSGFSRGIYTIARAAVAPFHCALNLLAALILFAFDKRMAMKNLLRATLIAGQMAGMLRKME
jgi:glycosyltransferase involved in cell wall biosynthesis